MENILYLDDYINLYNKRNEKLIVSKVAKDVLRNGMIINKEKFIKKFNSIILENNIKGKIFNENIYIIINNLYTIEDKLFIKEVFNYLNYNNIYFIQEIDYIKINKDKVYINCNYGYFYILYSDELGKVKINLYKNDVINKKLIIDILKILNKKVVFLYGKNYKEIKSIIDKEDIEYYYYEYSENLIIKLILNNNFDKF